MFDNDEAEAYMYLYGFMIPFCIYVSSRVIRPCSSTYRIIQILDLLHQSNHGITLTVSNIGLLRHSKTMLSTDTSVPLLDPLVYPGLDCLLNSLVESSYRDVQM